MFPAHFQGYLNNSFSRRPITMEVDETPSQHCALHLYGGAACEHTVAGVAELLHGGPPGRIPRQQRAHGCLEDSQAPPLVHSLTACEASPLPGQLAPVYSLYAVHHLCITQRRLLYSIYISEDVR